MQILIEKERKLFRNISYIQRCW